LIKRTLPVSSVLIVVKDERSIASTLNALQSQIQELHSECIVVDASGTRLEDIKNANPWVRWIQFNQPVGANSTISAQRNMAVREARSDILLFCDAGGVPSQGWMLEMFNPLFNGEFSLVGGPLEFFNGDVDLGKRNFQNRGEQLKYPSCGNIGFTRAAYEESVGFNEKILVAEDDDFFRQLEKVGILSACIPSAVMRIDVGDRKRRIKRAWRYGRGIVKLLTAHQDLVMKRLRQNPDIWLYPILIPSYALAGVSALLVSPHLLAIPIIISSLIIFKNRNSPQPIFEHCGHFIYGLGSLWELLQRRMPKINQIPILQYPNDESLYIKLLIYSLNTKSLMCREFFSLTKSSTLNLLLTPFLTPVLKVLGVKIINIHWIVGKWQLKWASNFWGRQLLWYWFLFWINSLKIFQIRMIYTVHDVLFHSKVFNDDRKTQKYMMDKADALVFLNELSKERILESLPKKTFDLIPEGPLKIETAICKTEMRQRLGVPESKILLVLVGRLEAYKGVDLLLQAATMMPNNFAIRVAGVCQGSYLRELESLANDARKYGADIDLLPRVLTDQEFAAYLNCADYFIYPCRDVNNSGSLNAALTAYLPVIVPDRPELAWVFPECKVVMRELDDLSYDFKECFTRIQNISDSNYQQLKIGTQKWASERSWKMVSQQYEALYREVLNG